jgi:hypothetical protein
VLHYIIVRGIDKTVIFRDDRDKIKFLEKMGVAVTGRNSDYHVPNSPVNSAYAPRAYLGLLQRQVVKPVVNSACGIHCNVSISCFWPLVKS